MKTLKLWRTFQEGLTNLKRSGWLTFATLVVLSLSLFLIGLSGLVSFATHTALESVKDRIQLTVFFNPDVTEERVLAIRGEVAKHSEIVSITYVSPDEALRRLMEGESDKATLERTLEQIGGNPLTASLDIRAREPAQYEVINTILEKSFRDEILKSNFSRNQSIFEKQERFDRSARTAALSLGAIFTFIALIVTFYTISIAIHSRQQDFEVMRLVGASNLYMRMPFFFQGIILGGGAGIIATALLAGVARALVPYMGSSFPQGNFFQLFLFGLPYILPGLLLLGALLGIFSSSLAIRKYRKI